MSKPWRMVAVHLGAWTTFATLRWQLAPGGLTLLDWTCLLVIAGCVQTVWVRLASTLRLLAGKDPPVTDVLHDPIFRFYVEAVAVLLGVAGAILALLTFALRRDVRSIWLTYRGWLIMAPTFLGCMALGRHALVILFGALSLLGVKEFSRATGLYRDWLMTGVVYAWGSSRWRCSAPCRTRASRGSPGGTDSSSSCRSSWSP